MLGESPYLRTRAYKTVKYIVISIVKIPMTYVTLYLSNVCFRVDANYIGRVEKMNKRKNEKIKTQ